MYWETPDCVTLLITGMCLCLFECVFVKPSENVLESVFLTTPGGRMDGPVYQLTGTTTNPVL